MTQPKQPENNEVSLPQRMRNRADADGLPADHPVRAQAHQLQLALDEFANIPIKKFLGAWARARRTWSDYTGYPLI